MSLFPGRILIGTSGWDYDDWVGPFYRDEKHKLAQYCRVFPTTEINSTFYSLPTPSLSGGLARATPRGFVFSAKLYKGITHEKKLNPKLGVDVLLREYFNAIEPLKRSGKLGPILIQMPPRPRKDFPYFEDFLSLLPENFKYAVEFRDHSWLDDGVFKLLEKYGVAYVIVDEPLLPPIVKVTSDIAYIRWHGRGARPWYYYQYREEELREWVPRVREVAERVNTLYGYFNNHFRGYAPRNALQMLRLLGIASKTQLRVLEQIDNWFRVGEALKRRETALKKLSEGASLEDILSAFTTKGRLERGVQIPDDQVKVEYRGPVITGRVKDYSFTIDTANRVMRHDCADWEKTKETKMLCKHMVKVFLSIPAQRSREILEDLARNMELWVFE